MSRASNTAKKLDNELEVDVINNTQATVETTNEITLSREKIEEILNRGLSVFWGEERLAFFEKLTEKEILGLHAYLQHKGHLHYKSGSYIESMPNLTEDEHYFFSKLDEIAQKIREKRAPELEQFFTKIQGDMDISALNELHTILNNLAYGPNANEYNSCMRRIEGRKKPKVLSVILNVLIDNSEKFEKVFQTSKGSTYFQIKTGESLRIKKSDEYKDSTTGLDKIITIEENISKETFFLNQEEVKTRQEEIKTKIEQKSYDLLFDKPLTKADYAIGSVVLEINVYSETPRMKAEVDDKYIRISCISDSPSFHIGDEITKIIK